jgi:Mn-dependent DtxR family transcriptional regulator
VPALKPKDLAVILDLCRHGPPRPPYGQIAAELSMSASEVHAAVSRAASAGLVHSADLGNRPSSSAIEEFLLDAGK